MSGATWRFICIFIRIDCLIITFILKCKIKIVPVEFYIPVSAFIYLTPVERKLILKVNPPLLTLPLPNYNYSRQRYDISMRHI